MGQPEKPRAADDLVEPLFAGLRGADTPGDEGVRSAGTEPSAPWRQPARAPAPEQEGTNPDGDRAPLRLYLKALFLLIVLIGAGAVFYFVFGV